MAYFDTNGPQTWCSVSVLCVRVSQKSVLMCYRTCLDGNADAIMCLLVDRVRAGARVDSFISGYEAQQKTET